MMDDYELHNVLGFGAFGRVRKVVRKRDELVRPLTHDKYSP
jgi:hypothetical protein